MARILIRESSPVLERLLVAVVTRCGHESEVLAEGEARVASGDLLLLDPTAADAVARVESARRSRPGIPIVCVGSDPLDPLATSIGPTSIVPKPFRLAELVGAITLALHEPSR